MNNNIMWRLIKVNNKGFTLMELLIVIAILGILVAIGTGSFTASQIKAKDMRRKSNLRAVATALDVYFTDKGQYPADDGQGNIVGCNATGDATLLTCAWGSLWQDQNGTAYMTTLPTDPKTSQKYFYSVGAGNTSFQLYARLENKKDGDLKTSGGVAQAYSGVACGTGVDCNYGTSSLNVLPESGRQLVADP